MTKKNVSRSTAFTLAIALTGLLGFSSCDTGACSGNCPLDLSGDVTLSVISQERSFPANLSVLFKVESISSTPIGRLDSTDFEIFDNDVLQSQFESSSKIDGQRGDFATSVVLVLDLSGSITNTENLAPLKSASKAFLESALSIDDENTTEASVWWFDGDAALKQLVGFTNDSSELMNAIDSVDASISTDASTNLYGAIVQSVEVLENRLNQIDDETAAIGAIAIFTDGTDQASRSTQSSALEAVSNADPKINMYSIGLRGEIDENFLKNVGKSGSVFASNINEITPQFRDIAERIRDQANSVYKLEYCSPRRSGLSHSLRIVVNAGGRVAQDEINYSAEGFSGGCTLD
ncbi:MAG: VWA domain-containing protein [Rhodothermales bacterium]|nr:VWA domain-containing protein [Rhodothermales bacterium]